MAALSVLSPGSPSATRFMTTKQLGQVTWPTGNAECPAQTVQPCIAASEFDLGTGKCRLIIVTSCSGKSAADLIA